MNIKVMVYTISVCVSKLYFLLDSIVEIWCNRLIRVFETQVLNLTDYSVLLCTGLKAGLRYYITKYLESSPYLYYKYLSNNVCSS